LFRSRGGTSITNPLILNAKSGRNRPPSTKLGIDSFVAATRRKSLRWSRRAPIGRYSPWSSARSNLHCRPNGKVPISSMKHVPPCDSARYPGRLSMAPLNAPLTWPTTMLSNSVTGMPNGRPSGPCAWATNGVNRGGEDSSGRSSRPVESSPARFTPLVAHAHGPDGLPLGIPVTLFESMVVGHVKGAFSGAIDSLPGYLAESHGGTCFMDEIGTLPLGLQCKLLRALDQGEYRPIGARRDQRSDFRLVAATNESIPSLVEGGRFRPDLAFRISGFVIDVPPLSHRADDIPILVDHFAPQISAAHGIPCVFLPAA